MYTEKKPLQCFTESLGQKPAEETMKLRKVIALSPKRSLGRKL